MNLAVAPSALHRGTEELPFINLVDGVDMQLMQVDLQFGLWIGRFTFAAGTTVQTHRHTGEVYAYTNAGSWRYLEYPEINTAGSYLFEPAGSTHTLHAPATNDVLTDVFFVVRGANLNLDENGNVESVFDAPTALRVYRERCEERGLPAPNVIGA
ncbi:MAG: 2,4'-dihydroxyacetophenone dioxygenase family protein [Gammaproteobacteria bacterium]